jgi:DNA polymerase-3 subunit gamma/tau
MYTALYRQWRPDTFEDVVGQDTIVRTLKNQLFSKRVAHAYLFCGSRGTGKTTTAKIFARAINCMSPTENGPCGQCENCVTLSSDNNMDIIEIDAASNNGVDEIRDLRDKVRFAPSVGNFKVYIIDEVHMLSMGAFNALLKTLEEPPAHAVFILATTEPHKLPATILSRCQRFDFKRIPQKVIVDRMKTICSRMNVTVEEAGLYTIARWAEGGMRDALSLLDQCMGFSGTNISQKDILNVLGTADQDFLYQAAEDIIRGNVDGLLHSISWLIDDGKDLNVFLRDILNHLRNLLMVKLCDDPAALLDVEEAALARLKDQAAKAGEARLVRSVDILAALESELKWSTQPRVLFELAVVKMCRPQQEDSMEALIDRIEVLERQLADSPVPPQPDLAAASEESSSAKSSSRVEEPSETYSASYLDSLLDSMPDPSQEAATIDLGLPSDNVEKADVSMPSDRIEKSDTTTLGSKVETVEVVDRKPVNKKASDKPDQKKVEPNNALVKDGLDPIRAWTGILENIRKERVALYSMLTEAKRGRLDGKGNFILMFPPIAGFFVAAIEQEENRTFIEDQILKVTGQKVRLRCKLGEEVDEEIAAAKDDPVESIIQVFGEDLVEIMDEE